jgi:Zn-finger nucleic acid-binding protein
VIDACIDGCGVWLDEGELRALEIFFERHRRDSELPVTWRIWATVLGVLKRKSKR